MAAGRKIGVEMVFGDQKMSRFAVMILRTEMNIVKALE